MNGDEGGTERVPGSGATPERAPVPFKILVPIDFSELSRRALVHAIAEAERTPDAEIYLFHVFEPMSRLKFVGKKLADRLETDLDRMEAMALAELETLVPEMSGSGGPRPRFTCRVASGRPWEEILRMAAGISADLIVMGAPSALDGARRAAGAQTERVVRRAPCTVVCVRVKDPYFVMP